MDCLTPGSKHCDPSWVSCFVRALRHYSDGIIDGQVLEVSGKKDAFQNGVLGRNILSEVALVLGAGNNYSR